MTRGLLLPLAGLLVFSGAFGIWVGVRAAPPTETEIIDVQAAREGLDRAFQVSARRFQPCEAQSCFGALADDSDPQLAREAQALYARMRSSGLRCSGER